MPLVEDMPEDVRALLIRLDGEAASDAVFIAAATDMRADGRFGQGWAVVTRERLRVIDTNSDEPQVLHDHALVDLKTPKADSLIGSGALVAEIDKIPIELIRYSNARSRAFGRMAKYLGDVAKFYKDMEDWEEAQKKKAEDEGPGAAEGPKKEEATAKGEDKEKGGAEDKSKEKKPKQKPEYPELHEDEEEEKHCSRCGLLLPEGTKVCPACLKKHKVLLRILAYIKPFWKATAVVTLLFLMNTALSLVPPYLTRPLIDDVLTNTVRPAAERVTLLGYLILGLFGVTALIQVVVIARGRLNVWLGTRVGHLLRTEVFQHVQMHSLKFFDKHKTGALMARIAQDTGSLENALIGGIPFFVTNILMLVGIGVVLFVLNWKLTLLILIPGPIVILLSRYTWKKLFRILHGWWHVRARLNAFLNDNLSGIRVIKAFAQESQEVQRFDERSLEMSDTSMRVEQFWETFFPLLSFITGLGTLIVWYVGGRQIINADGMTLGLLMTFIAYLGMFYGPMRFLSRITDWLARALASAERVFEILDSDPEVPDAEDAVSMPAVQGRVVFTDVTFGYDAHKPVLKGISMDIKQGEMIGLVGHSGAGKSTCINILCRLYDVQEGSIRIDGVDIRQIKQEDLRRQIGVVLQDTFLFNDTILENIRYAKPGATAEEVMAAAKAANAHDFIVKKPDGYDTVVGERGGSLSGGERQRISIARAILHNPRILILDEATSNVDTDTEKQIQDAIARLIQGRTTFAIAHRLSTLKNADRLVVLKDGEIEEMGTHDELLEKKGEFHRLVEMQSEMSKIKAVQR